jgi:hypothetical protein
MRKWLARLTEGHICVARSNGIASLRSPEKLRGYGFWDIPGAFSVVGEFARVGDTKVLDLEDQDKVAAQGGQITPVTFAAKK